MIRALPANRSMPAAGVIPVLGYADVLAAAAWLCRAFGFRERLRIGSHRIQLLGPAAGAVVVAHTDEVVTPAGSSVLVRVIDVDEHCAAARRGGADIVSAPQSYPYGERQYSARDPTGYLWIFSETVRDVEPREWGGELTGEGE